MNVFQGVDGGAKPERIGGVDIAINFSYGDGDPIQREAEINNSH